MSLVALFLQAIYIASTIGLALYGFQSLWLTWHYLRRDKVGRAFTHSFPDTFMSDRPTVSVFLPVYNERYVARRVIDACTRLSYPVDKLSICVLDDSDDSTRQIVTRAVQDACDRGFDVRIIRRPHRLGYKAGALGYAMEEVDAEYIALFDADFVPPRDFLLRTMPRFLGSGNERVGFVQTRWGHLNRDNSLLTRCEALALDGHFVVEQSGRNAAGFAFGFNGSGGIWRSACVRDSAVGGWQADTLTEDLDLSYRAQLCGWRGVYIDDVVVPAELPPQLMAFKRQQFRWAQGGVQTLRKVARRIWRSDWSFDKRLAATLHLGAQLLWPAVLAILLITLPLELLGVAPAAPLAFLSLMSVGPPLLYAISQRHIYGRGWWRKALLLPLLMLLVTGLILNNSVGALKGLFGGRSEFLRTPKFDATAEKGRWRDSSYRLPLQPLLIAEVLLACYALATSAVFALRGNYVGMASVLLYVFGFGFTAALGLWQELSSRSTTQPSRTRAVAETRTADKVVKAEFQALSAGQDS